MPLADDEPRSHDTSRSASSKLLARSAEAFPFAFPACGGDRHPAYSFELARAGKKIEAIKLYREETGVSLKEAKKVVESL